MKRLATMLAVFAIATCMSAPVALADEFGSVDQSGSYTYTYVKQDGDKTKVKVRQIDPRRFDKLRDHLTAKVDRINAKYQVQTNRYGQQDWTGGGANSVSLDQSGSGNFASATQTGSNDSVAINQNGSANAAYTVQQGDNLQAVTNQSGDHNITFVLQRNRHVSRAPTAQDWEMANRLFQQPAP